MKTAIEKKYMNILKALDIAYDRNFSKNTPA